MKVYQPGMFYECTIWSYHAAHGLYTAGLGEATLSGEIEPHAHTNIHAKTAS